MHNFSYYCPPRPPLPVSSLLAERVKIFLNELPSLSVFLELGFVDLSSFSSFFSSALSLALYILLYTNAIFVMLCLLQACINASLKPFLFAAASFV